MVKDFFNCDEHEEDDGLCYFQLMHELGQGLGLLYLAGLP